MKNYLSPYLKIEKTTHKGLGVFTIHTIEPNTLIEIAPVIELNEADTEKIHTTHLHDYYFSWGDEQKHSAIALGYVSLYNHSAQPNCYAEFDFENNTISIYSKIEINAGEELFIDYTMGEENKTLWFNVN